VRSELEEVEARVTDLCDQLEAAKEHTTSTEELMIVLILLLPLIIYYSRAKVE